MSNLDTAKNKWESLLSVGAEGGSLAIIGLKEADQTWRFKVIRDESTILGLLDEITREDVIDELVFDTWEEALSNMDRYPWVTLFPIYVHDEYTIRIFRAVRARTTDKLLLTKWASICSQEG